MVSTHFSVKYRPVRIGLLVREGSLEDLSTATAINTLLWGGIRNPIIPVKSSNPQEAGKLIKLYNVDILHSVIDSPETKSVIEAFPFLKDSHNFDNAIFQEYRESNKKFPGFLDLKDLIDLLWENEFKNPREETKSPFLLPKWEDNDPCSHLFQVMFGYFPKIKDIELLYDYEKAFAKGLMAETSSIGGEGPIGFNPYTAFTPIRATDCELAPYGGGNYSTGPGIYIGYDNNFDDLINYWNMRAAGITLWFYSLNNPARTEDATKKFIVSLDERIQEKGSILRNNLTLYYSHPEDTEKITQIINEKIVTQRMVLTSCLSEHAWNGYNIRPATYFFDWQNAVGDSHRYFDQEIVTLKLPEKDFLASRESEAFNKFFAIHINEYSDFSHPGYTLNPPFFPELNEFYSRNIAYDPWKVRANEEGITYIIDLSSSVIDLHPLKYELIIEEIFKILNINAKISQAGLLTKKIIDKMGDLENARHFKISGVRKLLEGKVAQNNTRPPTYTRVDFVTQKDAIKTIACSDFDKHKNLYIEKRESGELTLDMVFNYLLKQDMFRAGLEMHCNECNLKSWLSLTRLDDNWICEYCGGKNQTTLQLVHEKQGEWKFRKSGLFAKDNNQEGAVPVILTLLGIKGIIGVGSRFVYSSSLELRGDGIDCETDLFILEYGRGEKISIAIGECKSEWGTISMNDCNNLLSVANALSASRNIQPYIIFSKTAENFTQEEIGFFQKIKSRDAKLILLTSKELEAHRMYWKNRGGLIDSDVPEKYANSLDDLAKNSYARYLKPAEKNRLLRLFISILKKLI